MVQLEGFRNRYPAQLSGGQQQRVALARALVFEPQLVLMDEPLGALDKQLREQMQMEIKHLHERLGVTVVYVTHDQGEALTMSDRVAVFHQGQIQQIEDPRTLYEKPLNTFVANFLGENNRLPAHLLERRGESCTVKLGRGETVEALAVNVGATGSPVSLSIRPERVLLNSASASCPNRFTGRVAEFIYPTTSASVSRSAASAISSSSSRSPSSTKPCAWATWCRSAGTSSTSARSTRCRRPEPLPQHPQTTASRSELS